MNERISALDEILTSHHFFAECLLHDFRMVDYGYGVEVSFNIIWEGEEGVRSDILERPVLVTLRLMGVEHIRFDGGLTDAMRSAPEKIGWGLAEISQVRRLETVGSLGMSVQWEGRRRLDVEFQHVEVV